MLEREFFDRVPVVWIIKRQENRVTWEKYDRWWLYDRHRNVKSLIWLNPDGCFSLYMQQKAQWATMQYKRERKSKQKTQPEHLKMCTFNFVPLKWGELFQVLVRRRKSIASIHDTTSFIIFKYHYVQSVIQYNTPAQPRKHWLYTNKISHFINRVSLSATT